MQKVTAPMDWFSSPEQDARIMSAWEHLLDGGKSLPGHLRGVIDESWRRCLDGRVDPAAHRAPPPLDKSGLARWRSCNARLVSASLPLMQQTRDFLEQTGTILLLTDPEGIILQQEGDMHIVEPASEAGLMPGYNWTELNCGTNAIGTALALGRPVQIHGAEHFCAGIKRWTCSATVIRDPVDSAVLGVIDVSGLAATYSRHSLALTVALAGRIESRLAKLSMERRLQLLDHCMAHFAPGRSDGVLALDERCRLLKANPQAAAALARHGVSTPLSSSFALPGVDTAARGGSAAPGWLAHTRIETVRDGDEVLGYLVVIPAAGAAGGRRTMSATQADAGGRAEAAGATVPGTGGPRGAAAFARIVGSGATLRAAVAKAGQLAASSVPVLLAGETGVGKELFAQGLHLASPRANGPFVALNCGGLSRDLLASELFGYAEGAFTGARKSGAAGKIEAANGGTLFLDEIGEMPLEIQPHLLRVLEEGEIYRLGENTPRKVDFRLVAATHRNLRDEIAQGRFRMDLFYRIAVTTVAIPPLRERRDDMPVLIDHWLARLCARDGLPRPVFDDAAYASLLAYDWPGNVRELRNVLESSLLMARDGVITLEQLPPEIACGAVADGRASAVAGTVAGAGPIPACAQAQGSLEAVELDSIRLALVRHGGNLTQAARQLGIAKSTLYQKIRKHGLLSTVRQTRVDAA
ncbi:MULTISPECIES: sigma-54-dependent Fis family transcriptional regulator [Cupriavidus]|nr:MULTISPECIES: sigma-54-dependent Fis family transcriptional regulator [Cupriavidus]